MTATTILHELTRCDLQAAVTILGEPSAPSLALDEILKLRISGIETRIFLNEASGTLVVLPIFGPSGASA